jgi:hypothetical protein
VRIRTTTGRTASPLPNVNENSNDHTRIALVGTGGGR